MRHKHKEVNSLVKVKIININTDSKEGFRSMANGTVKWFNNAKGFGFIRPEEGGDDIFAHYSTIQMEGYRTLKAGQPVDYELNDGPKGQNAASIKPTDIE